MLAPNTYGCQRGGHGVLSYPKLIGMSTTNAVVTFEAVAKHIIDLVKNDLGSLDVTVDSSLQDQGLDSLKIMSLVFKIEDHYDIFLDEADADDLRTVRDLAAVVVRRIEQQQ